MTATLDRRRRQPDATATGTVRRAQARFDRVRDALGPRAVRERLQEWQRKLGVTALGGAALLSAVSLWIVARIIAGTAIYLFAYGALLIFVMSVVIAPRNLKLKGEREGLYPRGREGDRFDVTLTMEAKRRVTTFMLEERVPDRLGRPVRVPVTKLSKGEVVEHRYALRCSRRGVYNVGPLVAVAQDPLGLFKRETVVAEPFELLVHPRIEVVSDRALTRAHEDPPIRPPISRPWPSGMEFYGMREYVPGDDVRRIVWRASARTGKTMVWDAEQGITDRITIILDTDRTNHSREAEDLSESFETGVRVAASLAVRHLRDNYEVRMEVNGGPLQRPMRGVRNQTQILDSLARIETDREPLTKAIQRLITNPQRDAHNVLVTPRLGELEAAQLKLFLNTGVSVLVIALLWDEEDTFTVARAASLGCQVIGVHPGDDLKSALYQSGTSVA